MKKTLIALAAVAVTSTAFAQNVTISGRLDMGTVSSKTTGTANDGSVAKNSTLAGANGTKTGSRITFAGTEDLGGGLTAFFNIESSLNNSVIGNRNLFVGARGSFGSVQVGRYLNTFSAIRDSHYSIAGGAGGAFLNQHIGFNAAAGDTIRNFTGVAATALMTATTTTATSTFSGLVALDGATFRPVFLTSPAGNGATSTAVYSFLAGDTANGAATNASSSMASAMTISDYNAAVQSSNAAAAALLNSLMSGGYANRSNNALAYTTPKFGDFTLTVGLVDDNIESNDRRTTRPGQNQTKVSAQSYSLAYGKGPLNARLTVGKGKITAEVQGVPASTTAGAVTQVGESTAKSSDTALMVSYDFGVAQAYVMDNRTKSTLNRFNGAAANATRKTEATEIGVKMPMGAFEPFVTIGRGEITAAAGGVETNRVKTSAYQLGLNYTLSKRTHVYASTGEFKARTEVQAGGAAGSFGTNKTTGYSIGLVHNF